MSEFVASEELADLFFNALDHGFGSIEGGNGPLIAFAFVVDDSGARMLHRFVTEQIGDGVVKAQEYVIATPGLRRYAIAWDGYVTIEGTKWDAILVEAGEATQARGIIVAQRYAAPSKRPFRNGGCERIGNPVVVEHPLSRLWGRQ